MQIKQQIVYDSEFYSWHLVDENMHSYASVNSIQVICLQMSSSFAQFLIGLLTWTWQR